MLFLSSVKRLRKVKGEGNTNKLLNTTLAIFFGAVAGTYTQMGSSPSAKVPRIGFEPATNGDISRTTPLFSACDSQLRF
jgi:hypothetical protein